MAVFPTACNENHSLFIPPNVGGARGARAVTVKRVNIHWLREGQTQHAAPGDSQCWQTKKSNQIKQNGINYTKARKIFQCICDCAPFPLFLSGGHHIFFMDSRELIEKSSIILRWPVICLKGTLSLPICWNQLFLPLPFPLFPLHSFIRLTSYFIA